MVQHRAGHGPVAHVARPARVHCEDEEAAKEVWMSTISDGSEKARSLWPWILSNVDQLLEMAPEPNPEVPMERDESRHSLWQELRYCLW